MKTSVWAMQAAKGTDLPAGAGQRWRWAFSGGKPASQGLPSSEQSDLLFTGDTALNVIAQSFNAYFDRAACTHVSKVKH